MTSDTQPSSIGRSPFKPKEGNMTAPINIMVVDDESSICQNVTKILAKSNYKVTSATSAKEALEKLCHQSFELVISDIVMPEMNGLQFLKSLKDKWPATKTVMMTAYASTDTAVKAIRLGALDYLPKPFTPDELRTMVEEAITGKLIEAKVSQNEKESISVIDVDAPFDFDEVAGVAGEAYARSLGSSDMPVVEITTSQPLEGFCSVGAMVCDIFKKLGATCKAGTKTSVCPQKKAKKGKDAKAKDTPDVRTLIGVDQPFNYDEVKAVTGPEYLNYLQHDGVVVPTYEELKANIERMIQADRIDVDMPFDRDEVTQSVGETYARQLGRSDMPVIEISADETVEGFCEVGAMVCDIFKKLGATCKAGTKTRACPQKKAKKKKGGAEVNVDTRRLINPDLPFDYDEVAAATGTDYVNRLIYDGAVQMPYEQLKANYLELLAGEEQAAQAKPAAIPQIEKNSVLVIDDEMSVNNNIRKILSKKEYRVDQAATKEEALSKIAAKGYELVMLDLRIPGVNGLELLGAIRKTQPQARVIIVTGYASIDTAKEAARMGAIDYLPKPFTPNEIRGAADRAMKIAA
jgi:DNA-binding response OmpR family regulator